MELAAQEEWVVRKFHDLDIGSVGSCAADPQSGGSKRPFVLAVELVAMTVALADLALPISSTRQRVGLQFARPCTQPHRAAQFFHTAQLAQLVNHAMRGRGIKLTGIRLLQPAYIARELDARGLHTQANSEVRHFVLARILNA